MKLKSITIEKYKSIQNPIEITIDDSNRFYAFIGKNGSGKTNVLQAIRYALAKEDYFTRSNKKELLARYKYVVTTDEKARFFSAVDLNTTDDEIEIIYDKTEPAIKRVDAPIIKSSVKKYKTKLEDLYKSFKKCSKNYINNLKQIEADYNQETYLSPNVVDINRGSITSIQKYNIDNCDKNIKQNIDEFDKFLKNVFDGDTISINASNYIFDLYLYSIEFYKIAPNNRIELSPIVATSLGLKKDALEQANLKLNADIEIINKNLESSFDKIQNCIQEFKDIAEKLKGIFVANQNKQEKAQAKNDDIIQSFCSLLKQEAFKTCYYIDNEESLLFYGRGNGNDYYRQENNRTNYNSQNPILSAIDDYLNEKNLYKEEESLFELGKISPNRLSELVNFINKGLLSDIIPKFDADEIKGFHLETRENGLVFYVEEKNGEKIDFNETSLGRRWYLTYGFIKQLLKSGDLLFIDEPAAFLHPQAQAEIKQDLQELSKRGVYVFITTHSPYMIPENWHNIYNVSMTENGTTIKRFSDDDEVCRAIKDELGVLTTNDILFNLSKTLLLVEGTADKSCIEKFARKLNYNIDDYNILPCNGHPIIGITYLCIANGIKFKALLDLDNKDKPEIWLKHQYGYKEYLETIKTNKDCVFTPSIRNKKSIEDCFNEKDSDRYFSETEKKKRKKGTKEYKLDLIKFEVGEEFEQETLHNFEQLFNELGIPKIDKQS